MAENSDQRLAGVLRQQQRMANVSRPLTMGGNSSNPVSYNGRLQPVGHGVGRLSGGEYAGMSYGAVRHRARQTSSGSAVARVTDEAMSKIGAPVRAGTGQLLKQSWIHLIDSWGLTLIYINIHAMASLVSDNFFPKLGHEWAGGLTKDFPGVGNDKATKEMTEEVGDRIGIFEKMGLGFLDLAVGLALLAITVLVVLIAQAIVDPASVLGQIFARFFSK